jgi:hypothetical protein
MPVIMHNAIAPARSRPSAALLITGPGYGNPNQRFRKMPKAIRGARLVQNDRHSPSFRAHRTIIAVIPRKQITRMRLSRLSIQFRPSSIRMGRSGATKAARTLGYDVKARADAGPDQVWITTAEEHSMEIDIEHSETIHAIVVFY